MDWALATEGDRLLQCGIVFFGGVGGGGGEELFKASLYVCSIEHYVIPCSFQTVSRGHILVFFNRHCFTMNLVKEKQGGLVPPGLKRWPFKLSPPPAGPAAAVQIFLNRIKE